MPRTRTRTLSTAQAAELTGIQPGSFRREANRARAAGTELQAPRELWPDARTPLYDDAKVRKWLAGRPGSGWWR